MDGTDFLPISEQTTGSVTASHSAIGFPNPRRIETKTLVVGKQEAIQGAEKEIAVLRSEMSILRAEVSALRRQVQTQQVAQGGEDIAKNLPDDPNARAEAERRHQEQMAVVEANFQGERADANWSSQTVTTVQSALASRTALQALVRGVECRSHTCRMEIANDGSHAVDKALPLFAHQLADSLPSITYNQADDGNGGTTTILYLSRDPELPSAG